MSSNYPIVTWTTPFQRAEKALQRAGEHLSLRRADEGLSELALARAWIECAEDFLRKEGLDPPYAPK